VAARADVRGGDVDAQGWRLGGLGCWLGLGGWLGRSGLRVTPVVAAGAALGKKGVKTGVLSGQTTRTGNGSGCFHLCLSSEVTGCTEPDGKRPKKETLARVRAKYDVHARMRCAGACVRDFPITVVFHPKWYCR
jgi:hypothetical protein